MREMTDEAPGLLEQGPRDEKSDRSPARPKRRPVYGYLVAAGLVLISSVGLTRGVTDLKALEPAEGATVGPRPVFRFAAPSGWAEAGAIIELSRDHWKTVEKVWDMRFSRRGWDIPPAPQDRAGALRCPESLPEGEWEWRVRPSQGSIEAEPPRALSFKIDATPPAEIEGLKLNPRPDGSVLLSWDPVLNDIEGKPETVDHYVVYRYSSKGIFPQTPPMAVGFTKVLFFVDCHPSSGSGAAHGRTSSGKDSGTASPKMQTDAGSDPPAGQGGLKGRPALPDGSTRAAGDAGKGTGTSTAQGGVKTGQAAEPSEKVCGPDPRKPKASEFRDPGGPLYYKVVAVDLAGNELGIRSLP